jgi:1-acyl-sn-glycerol-3-phosphate acyltransferase
MTSSIIISGVRCLTAAEVHWAGSQPSVKRRIYFANHSSHLDYLLILCALPEPVRNRVRPVAASDYWTASASRRWLTSVIFQAVLIDRPHGRTLRSMNPLRPLVDALDAGYSLVLFPEGTRGSGGRLLPFKAGIFHLAVARPDVELVPVRIDNAWRALPKGHFAPAPARCAVTFGAPTRLAEGERKDDFLERLRHSIECLAYSKAA